MYVANEITESWKGFLDAEELPKIGSAFKREVTAQILENTIKSINPQLKASDFLGEAGENIANVSQDLGGYNANNSTNISGYDQVMIAMVRRNMPKLVAYDVCGVQAMKGPSQLIFALRAVETANGDTDLRNNPERFYNEPDSAYSGTGTQAGNSPAILNETTPGTYTYGTGMSTADGEQLGTAAGAAFKEIGFTIEKINVLARERALKVQYTDELEADLRNVHGLSAESILNELAQSTMLADINREVLRTLYTIAKPGCQNTDLATPGVFDFELDSNGRWLAEKIKGFMFQIEREANAIARETRMGKGNVIICSADVASALALTGSLDPTAGETAGSLEIDETGNTYVGMYGKFKVFVDPYVAPESTPQANAGHNFIVVGYKGANPLDAGFFYCPYIPMQMVKIRDSSSMQPKIGYKTRYGMVANPFAQGLTRGLGALNANSNVYYRRSKVINLSGKATVA